MLQVKCPICQKTVLWNDDFPFRPFCSKRCKIRDLGAWADESYKVPTQESSQEESPGEDPSQSE